MSAIHSVLQWYPSPCQDPHCEQNHRKLEDGNKFHPGTYIKIKGWNSFEACLTKLKETHEIIPLPTGVKHFNSFFGALDIRTFILEKDFKPRFYDYATGFFPCVVEALTTKDTELVEHVKQVQLPRILEDASNLEDISHGI